MNTQPIADLMSTQIIESKKVKSDLPLVPEEDFIQILQEIETNKFDPKIFEEDDRRVVQVHFTNGYMAEFILEYEVVKKCPETNEPIEWNKDKYTVTGGDIFKDNQIFNDPLDYTF